jgi:hypothetical protein
MRLPSASVSTDSVVASAWYGAFGTTFASNATVNWPPATLICGAWSADAFLSTV